MNERTLWRIIAGFAGLVGLLLIVRVGSYVTRARPSTGGALSDAFEALRSDTIVGAVIMGRGGTRVDLARSPNGWTVNGYVADSVATDQLVRSVQEARVTDLVARSETSHERLGVSRDSAWTVTLRGRRDSAQFLLGASGRGYDQTYVRLPAENDVYVVSGSMRSAVARPLAEWRDKAIVRVDTAKVRRLLLEFDRRQARIARTDSVWTVVGGTGVVDRAVVTDILSELARFDATGFADDSVAFSGKQRRRIVALGAAGDTLAAVEMVGDSTRWLARSRGDPETYDVAPYRVDRAVPALTRLITR
jgi:hypothetical protein